VARDETTRLARRGRIIAAWGSNWHPYPSAPAHVMGLLEDLRYPGQSARRQVEALRLTTGGHPWHPLFVRGDVQPVKYSAGPMTAERKGLGLQGIVGA
jgi:hypothetical protein